jgi:hypothetical protein
MKAIAQNKLTKKLLLLLILAGALIYLRTPPQARAFDCCLEGYDECVAQCDGNRSCLNECLTILYECHHGVGCPPSQ